MNYNKFDLSGQWNCQLSVDNKISNSYIVKLPGTTSENKIGKPLELVPTLTKEAVKGLKQKYSYVGEAMYQRIINIPESFGDKVILLYLERVMFQSKVFIDDIEIGSMDSLSVPHIYDLTKYVIPNQAFALTIKIDNSDVENIGAYPSAYTDETQTIWNGIVGKIELQALDKIHIKDLQVYPNISNKTITIKLGCKNYTEEEGILYIDIQPINKSSKKALESLKLQKEFKSENECFEFTYVMGEDIQLWDEFTPNLYDLKVTIEGKTANNETYHSSKTITFGMKEFKAVGTQFEINGGKTFLRGTLDCCIYPLTGYPPTDLTSWLKVFQTIKDYGLNHLRFHSWCPPEEAFNAADKLGVYLCVEGPMWMDTWNGCLVGQHKEHYKYLPEEAIRIVDTYGNHPSFCLFSNGNELNGDFNLLADMILKLKQRDPRPVYTLTTNWDRPLNDADDFFVTQCVDNVGIRGQYFLDKMVEGTDLDYKKAVGLRKIPIVSHEVGQYCVYPDIDEIPKYTGVLDPINFKAIKNDLISKQLLKYSKRFVLGSGKLALQLYKDDIEAALRTKGFGGFQLLDLHDFPGQSTATIGILNSFWESKNLIKQEEFRYFCSETVPLLRMEKRIYNNRDKFSAKVEISHFGAAPIESASVKWTIKAMNESIFAKGTFKNIDIPIGNGISIGEILDVDLNTVLTASKLSISLEINNTSIYNHWDIWVYPEANKEFTANIFSKFDSKVEKLLEHGASVLLLPTASDFKECFAGKFFPVFWSPVHFISKDPCGIYCDNTHRIFKEFPTDFYSSYQWKNLLENSTTMILDSLPQDFEPIVQVIPNFYNNHKLGNLLEAKVGKGKLILCTINLNIDSETTIETKQLRQSILAYMGSDNFNPKYTLSLEEIKNLFIKDEDRTASSSNKIDLAFNKPAKSDSEKSLSYSASKGNDGNKNSCWMAADANTGHYWEVDLGKIYNITSTRVEFAEKANYLYVTQVSSDRGTWKLAVNKTGQTIKCTEMTDYFTDKARYIRIIYNGLQAGIYASHTSFEVYGEE